VRIGVLHARIRLEERLLLEELERRKVDVERIHVEQEVFPLEEFRNRPAAPAVRRAVVGAAGSPAALAPPATPAFGDWGRFDAVLERCISHSRAMACLRVLDAWGVPCVNPWQIGEICGDKLTTNLALLRAGVPVPRARVAFTPESALAAIEELGYPAVLKPAVGSWGRLLARVRDRDAAEAVLEHKNTLGTYHHSIFYIQEHIDTGGRDIRSFVVGDRTICAIERRSEHWITNTARGAKSSGIAVSDELDEISRAAARAVGGGIVAVDVFDTPGGLLVNEVNYTMEFKNSITTTGVDIPARIVDYLLEVAEGRVLVPARPPEHPLPAGQVAP